MHARLPPSTTAPRRPHLLLAALAATALAVYGSFVPLEFHHLDWADAVRQFKRVPYLELGVYKRADLVANIVLFLPLGFLWLGALDIDRRTRTAAMLAAPLIAGLLAALAVAVEFFQQWTVRRTVSQNDMMAESVGAIAGILLWLLAGRWLTARVRDVVAPGEPVATRNEQTALMLLRLRRFLLLYTIGFVLYNIQPLDVALSAASLRQKYDDGRILLTPFVSLRGGLFNALWQSGSDILLFLPIGMWLRLGENRLRRFPLTVVLIVLAACLIEAMQLFIFTRYADTTDLFTGALGGILGALLVGRLAAERDDAVPTERAGAHTAIGWALCLAYTVPLLIFSWEPFTLVATRAEFWRRVAGAINPPFSGHYFGTEFNALTKVMRDVMYFVPYGAALRWSRGDAEPGVLSWIGITLLAVALGITIETGQAAVIGRYADLTSVFLNVIGAWLGWWMWGLIFRRPPLVRRSPRMRPDLN